jgi:hypothetical protein
VERRRWRWHTHARGHALSLRFAPRARLVSRCVRATEKQHPASFSVLVTPSSSNTRGQCTLFFSHARFFYLYLSLFPPLSLSLSHSFSPARPNGKQTYEMKKKSNRHRTNNARFTVWCAARTGAYIVFRSNSQMLQRRRARYDTCECYSMCFTHEIPLSLSRRVSGRRR